MLQIKSQYPLKAYNTFAIAANAKFFIEINTLTELKALFNDSIVKTNELLILGGGSNMLFTKDFEGLVIKINVEGIAVKTEGDEVFVTAGAGVVWHDFVMFCVENGYAGVENLTLIPGTVGASPIQNIGAYGVEIKDVFYSCTAFERSTGAMKTFTNADCQFAYRDSVFKSAQKGEFIIVDVTYKLSKTADIKTHYGAINAELENRNIQNPTIADVSNVVASIRVSKLPEPRTIGNAGSFFKNPVIANDVFEALIAKFPDMPHYAAPNNKAKLAAGWLIEQCDFKGVVDGNTGTWKNQALVLVNRGGATGEEVYKFSEKVINAVQLKFGIKLEREVNIL